LRHDKARFQLVPLEIRECLELDQSGAKHAQRDDKQPQRDPEGVAPTEKQQQCLLRQRQALPAIANQQLQATLHDRRGILGNDQAGNVLNTEVLATQRFRLDAHAQFMVRKTIHLDHRYLCNGEQAITVILGQAQQQETGTRPFACQSGQERRCTDVLVRIIKKQVAKNHAAWLMLGGSYFIDEKYSAAEMVFERLILMEPDAGKFSIALLDTLWKSDRTADALEEINRFMSTADAMKEKETFDQYIKITDSIADDLDQGHN
jgi:hypothetical protein